MFGLTPQPSEGRNLLVPEDSRPALSYATLDKNGLALGPSGAVSIGPEGVLHCYRWDNDKMVPEQPCSPDNLKMGQIAKAQRGVRDYIVRSTLLAPDGQNAQNGGSGKAGK